MEDDGNRQGADHVYESLVETGIDLAVGIPGRGSLPLDTRIAEGSPIDYVMARHETAVPYVAWGYFEAGGGPAATITVPGPGDTNAANGLRNATMDRVPVVHVVPEVHPDLRGREAIHEIDPSTFDDVVKANVDVATPGSLPGDVAGAIEEALTPPLGPARLGVPFLGEPIPTGPATVSVGAQRYESEAATARAADLLAGAERPVVYVGVGARRSSRGRVGVRALVDALDAPVVASYKGKGVFPETEPNWAGTTGHQLPAGAVEMLDCADVVVALGTTFGGPTTQNWSLPMGERLIHVTREPARIGVAYDADVAVVEDAGRVAETLAGLVDDRGGGTGWDGTEIGRRVRAEYVEHLEERGVFEERSPAPTPAVVRALREALPEEAIVVADIAEFRTWALQLYPAPRPESFVVTDSWTSMGVGLPGAIGAKLAAPDRPVVCFTGDGGLMMCAQELHTAAEYDVDVTTVVFENGQYAMIDAAPELGRRGRFGWDSPDFGAIAEGYGCGASRASTPGGAAEAVVDGVESDRPTVVSVEVDPKEPSSMDAWRYESGIEFR